MIAHLASSVPALATLVPSAAGGPAPYETPPLWRLGSKLGYFVGLALLIGFTCTASLVVAPALRRVSAAERAAVVRRLRRTLALSGLVMLPLAWFQLAARVVRDDPGTSYGEALAPGTLLRFVTRPAQNGEWVSLGALCAAQTVMFLVLAVLLGRLLRLPADGPRVLPRSALLAAVLAPLATCLVSVPRSAESLASDELLDAVLVQAHIVGGSLWVGGLVMLAALPRDRHPGLAAARADMVRRFGVVALVSVGLVVVSGAWLAWEHVGTPAQLVTTTFGLVLLAKTLCVLGMVLAGAWNQLVLIPRLEAARTAGDERSLVRLALGHFPRVVALEVLLGALVLLAVPFLAGSARKEAGHATAGALSASGLALGLLLVATVVGSFLLTARASDALAARASEGLGARGADGALETVPS